MAVILLDLGLQQQHAMQCAFETLGRAHDTDKVPHKAAQLIPVVQNHHILVGVTYLCGIPLRHGRRRCRVDEFALNIASRRHGKDEAF